MNEFDFRVNQIPGLCISFRFQVYAPRISRIASKCVHAVWWSHSLSVSATIIYSVRAPAYALINNLILPFIYYTQTEITFILAYLHFTIPCVLHTSTHTNTHASDDRMVYKSDGGRHGTNRITSNTIQTKTVTTFLCSFGIYFVGFCGSQRPTANTYSRQNKYGFFLLRFFFSFTIYLFFR